MFVLLLFLQKKYLPSRYINSIIFFFIFFYIINQNFCTMYCKVYRKRHHYFLFLETFCPKYKKNCFFCFVQKFAGWNELFFWTLTMLLKYLKNEMKNHSRKDFIVRFVQKKGERIIKNMSNANEVLSIRSPYSILLLISSNFALYNLYLPI